MGAAFQPRSVKLIQGQIAAGSRSHIVNILLIPIFWFLYINCRSPIAKTLKRIFPFSKIQNPKSLPAIVRLRRTQARRAGQIPNLLDRFQPKKLIPLPNQRWIPGVILIDYPAYEQPVPFDVLAAFNIAFHPGGSAFRYRGTA